MSTGSLRLKVTAAISAIALASASIVAASVSASEAAETPAEPNIVVILTDDQPEGMLDAMPTVQSEIAGKGTTYSNAIVPTSLCCPSRSSMLTGLYSNQTGVYGNFGPTQGGYPVFQLNGNESRTLATKLQDTNYSTGLFGKVMNGFDPAQGERRMLGWDRVVGASKIDDHYRYMVVQDAQQAPLESVPNAEQTLKPSSEHATEFYGKQTADFIRDVPADQPLLALYTPFAPHSPHQYDAKYANSGLSGSRVKNYQDFYEKDVSDKPFYVSYVKKWSKSKKKRWRAKWVAQTKMLRSVDDQVANIIDTLQEEGRLDNTVLIFTSDNGYHYGQNRLAHKNTPYRPATDVDLLVRTPSGPRGVTDDRLVTANVDVAATVLQASGVPNSTSGVPLGNNLTRAGVPMMASRERVERGLGRPAYCGFRTSGAVFIRYATGEEEYYNLNRDPYMSKNVRWKSKYDSAVGQLTSLARSGCSGVSLDYGTSFDTPYGGVAKSKKNAKKKTLKAARGRANPNDKPNKKPNKKPDKKVGIELDKRYSVDAID